MNSLHELLKVQMKRDCGVIELVGLREAIRRCFDRVGSGDHVPDASAVVADFDRVFGAGLLNGNIPVARLKGDFDFGFDRLFALVNTEECLAARVREISMSQ